MAFKIHEPQRFHTTKLDIFVVTIVIIVFLYAFLFDSFKPMLDETGKPMTYIDKAGQNQTIPRINMQFFIAPLIMCYEMLVLIGLDGKLKGRELPWKLYSLQAKTIIIKKIQEGIQEYKTWKRGNFKNK